jgi:hypothetical protein
MGSHTQADLRITRVDLSSLGILPGELNLKVSLKGGLTLR